MNRISIDASEGERRIRAAVRVILSPGVWLAIGAQILLFVLMRQSPEAEAGSPLRVLIVAAAVAAFLYVVTGASQALANERDTIGLGTALRAGATSFAPFLWLIVKVALLCGLGLNVLLYLVAADGVQPTAFTESLFQALPLMEGLISFVFVYWLPLVFLRRNFALFSTLRAALLTAWRRLPHAAYLAFLTLAPAITATLSNEATPLVWVLGVGVIAGVMDWIAFDYGIQSLRDEEPREPY